MSPVRFRSPALPAADVTPHPGDDTGGFPLTNPADSTSSGDLEGSDANGADGRTMTVNGQNGRSRVQAVVQDGPEDEDVDQGGRLPTAQPTRVPCRDVETIRFLAARDPPSGSPPSLVDGAVAGPHDRWRGVLQTAHDAVGHVHAQHLAVRGHSADLPHARPAHATSRSFGSL